MHPTIPLPRLRPVHAVALASAAACLFAVLAADLALNGPVTRADALVSGWFAQHAQPWTTHLMLALSAIHSTIGICLLAAAMAAVLVMRRQSQWLPVLVAVVPGGLVLNALVKLAFHRARPAFEHPLVTLTTFSFPSGHAAGATVWWGFVLVLWFARMPRPTPRAMVCGLAVAFVLSTALSRVYLGAHYPSDVLAGIAEGTFWLAVCFGVAAALGRHRAGEVPA